MEKKVKNTQAEDEKFMRLAFQQAEMALEQGEIPVGAILVGDGKIICKSSNQTELLQDVTAHAEIIAISSAGEYLQTKYFPDCTLYVTLEPCAMCAGAIGWAQIGRLVYAAADDAKGYKVTAPNVLHKKCKVTHGVMAKESTLLLQSFFERKRK